MVEADRVVTGAPVLTQDPERPTAEAVTFRHGRVLAVGSEAEVSTVVGPGTDRLELASTALVAPGFVDCHTHAARLGELHFRQDLSQTPGKDEALQLLEARAERTPEDGWVIGWNWDETQWRGGEPLTQADLDAVSTRHNVLARRVCGHRTVVNSRALEALDLDEATPGLETVDGEPSGVLSEDAADEAWEGCAPTYETCVKGLAQETRRLAKLGITTVADTAGPRDVRLLTRGAREGFFLQRSHLYVREALLDHVDALQMGRVTGPECSLNGVKIYTDGSIGARTAATHDAYADEDTTGMLLRDAEDVQATAERVDRLGLQLKAHAIGDRAIDAVLDGIEAADVPPEARPRIEHAEMLTPGQIDRMAELGVVCVMQPNFVLNWQTPGGLYEQALGEARAARMNPIRRVAEGGVDLAFSSDGMPYDPLYGIRAAVEHPTKREQVSVETALEAYTRGSAYALGREDELGVLREGALGDAVVLSEDPRTASDLDAVSVEATLIGGEVVHPAR